MTVGICFHGIGTCTREREDGESRYWMTTEVFHRVLDAVAEAPDVALSFDDGNRSDVELALPALRERGLRATFFVLAGRLEDPASLGAADLRDLRAAGMRIGNHGWTHTPWRGLSETDARRELHDARTALAEASGAEIADAALPLGRYDRKTLRRLHARGYHAVYTSDRFPFSDRSWLRARYSVTAMDTAASVARHAHGRPGLSELRNLAASTVKRMR
ncbi:polysaccharide deacetylase family protein [Microbacterium sp.]|uniref:polysaccharide deacetylase family protein n=1 Tax=Microbacterium sp. TaxID=51671 RepID=UPI00289BF898|nr:polysaccharide deacetylase family protein [Microbacterium sp.]